MKYLLALLAHCLSEWKGGAVACSEVLWPLPPRGLLSLEQAVPFDTSGTVDMDVGITAAQGTDVCHATLALS